MCRRHGLTFDRASSLLPIVQRALEASDGARDRLLLMVDSSLAKRSPGSPTEDRDGLKRDVDEEVLIAVSIVLHGWRPSGKMLDLGGGLREFLPEDFGPES
jgi:hypothetical protein